MAEGFDYAAYDALIAQGLSQRQAFECMGVKRSTGQDALKRRPSVAVAVVPPGPPQPAIAVPMGGEIDMAAIQADMLEIVHWWRTRKLRQSQPRQERPTVRWTIHIDPAWIERVKAESDAQRTSYAEVVDQVFRHYFEREV